jgi:hypothetical protein
MPKPVLGTGALPGPEARALPQTDRGITTFLENSAIFFFTSDLRQAKKLARDRTIGA